ncbi:MAG: PQQ-like beta-propeller repeat protein [Pirellulales bacterium]|nr:PQQ-like beta-propeller repeat protein [Pirellulales bacterium]
MFVPVVSSADEWPQWRGPQRDGVWREDGVVEKFDVERLPLKWSVPISSGYSGPTVADGRVYVTDRVLEPAQIERVHCFDWKSGQEIWLHSYDCDYSNVGYQAGPRASVIVDDGRAYSLGTMGHLFCFDAATGKILWQHDCHAEYRIEMPIWGISASPIVVDDLVIAQIGGAEGACIVAWDKQTGEERWKALEDRASYSAPILIEQAGKQVLVCWTGDHVAGLDPKTGSVYWQHPFMPTRMVIAITTPVVDGDKLFVSSFYDGSLMLLLLPDKPAVEQIWRRLGPDENHTESLHSIISTPYLKGDYVYGVDSYGELRCLEAATGDRVWENLTATPKNRWSTIHMVENDGRIWMFNERGELIISRLTPEGFDEISRTKLLDPTTDQLARRDGVCWAHPAYAYRHVFARNDKELVCASLESKPKSAGDE